MRLKISMLAVLSLAIYTCMARADWESVSRQFTKGELDTVKGPGAEFLSTRPSGDRWKASYILSNHLANMRGREINVHSAHSVRFADYHITCGHAGKSSHIALRIRLSEPVKEVVWNIPEHGRNVAPPATLTARYSRDGRQWKDAHKYMAGGGNYDPPQVALKFDPPTQEIYFGWFADVPSGNGWWMLNSTGIFTFTLSGKPIDDTKQKTQNPARDDLHGPRVIPDTFFGTTTHVNNEHMAGLLKDLQVPCVRIDFPWLGLEPGKGQYNLDPNLWILKSADLGVRHALDQLVVLTTPPSWAVGENGTYPNQESEKALEEFMFRIASKYKGKIRYWQAGNEPNMAIWRERFIPFLKAFHRGVKRADPRNKVVLCGFAGVEHEHLDAVYRLGGKPYFDILGAHPYTRPAMPEGGYTMRLKAIREAMRKYGDEKPVWVDEIGWNGVEPSMLGYLRSKFDYHRQYSGTEEEQARYLARIYLISATIPWVERVYFFHLHQEAAYTAVSENADHYMGLFTPWRGGQIRPKDAYFAVKKVVEVLKGATFKQRIETPPRIWALHFERGTEAVIALWSTDDRDAMKLGDASMITAVESMVGTPVLIDEGVLPLGGRPLYLKVAAKDAEKLKEQIRKAAETAARPSENSIRNNSGDKNVWNANRRK